jgi:integrase-like protein
MGIRDKPIAPGSPWQNAFAERLIGSIRRECVDHMVVLGEAHLRRTLKSYARYYNESRIHRSLSKDAPFPRAIEHLGVITSQPVLGGLHHRYCRILIFGTHQDQSAQARLRDLEVAETILKRRLDRAERAYDRALAPVRPQTTPLSFCNMVARTHVARLNLGQR